jgi:hypothetical protein
MIGFVNGFDIRKYATDSQHETKIASMTAFIYSKIMIPTPHAIDVFIRQRAPQTPLTGQMFIDAKNKYAIGEMGLFVLMALIQNDTMYGTKGIGAKLHNPGNIGNDDEGNTREYGTWENGVDAVAKWLDNHRVKA